MCPRSVGFISHVHLGPFKGDQSESLLLVEPGSHSVRLLVTGGDTRTQSLPVFLLL